MLLNQECGAASIYVVYKKRHKVPKAKFAARLSHIALEASTTGSAISPNNKALSVSNDVLERVNACFIDMRNILETIK